MSNSLKFHSAIGSAFKGYQATKDTLSRPKSYEKAQKKRAHAGPVFALDSFFFAAFWPQKFPYSITRTKTVEPLAKRVRTK